MSLMLPQENVWGGNILGKFYYTCTLSCFGFLVLISFHTVHVEFAVGCCILQKCGGEAMLHTPGM